MSALICCTDLMFVDSGADSYLDAIEEMIYADVEQKLLYRILRLLCMQSVTSGGVRSTRYDVIRRAIGQNYGLQHLLTLSNLERSGQTKSLLCFTCMITNTNVCRSDQAQGRHSGGCRAGVADAAKTTQVSSNF